MRSEEDMEGSKQCALMSAVLSGFEAELFATLNLIVLSQVSIENSPMLLSTGKSDNL